MSWEIGDCVVHQRDGICRITGTCEMGRKFEPLEKYFVLEPLYEQASKLYIPFDRAEEFLRDPVTKKEIDRMLKEAPSHDYEWVDDEKLRQKMLGDARKNASYDTLLALVSLFYEKRIEQNEAGRKFHSADEQFLKDMETRINREFAYALEMKPEDVPAYIGKRLK